MRKLSSMLLATVVTACAVEPSQSTAEQGELGRNMLAANMLAANMLAANMLAANMLAANQLSTQLNPDGSNMLLGSADGRFLLQYIVSCALPAGQNLSANVNVADTAPPATPYTCASGTCTFTGLLDLAPQWIDHKLSSDGQAWISSCLLARVNANQISEEISLRGSNSALAVTPAEAQLYTVQEGAFYGDVFTYPKPIVWIACEGAGQINGTFGGLVDRKCARPDPANPGKTICGFDYAGYCGDYSPQVVSAHACRNFDAASGSYSDCRASSGHHLVIDDVRADLLGGEYHHQFQNAITTYVTP
jgi:hypothetical protein